MAEMGRPTLFRPEYVKQGYELALLGLTDVEMARVWGVSEATIYNWKEDHFDFLEALQRGKDAADANVASRLYQRAMGYSHPAVKIFNDQGSPLEVEYTEHYPPDTTACIFWLKNRQRGKWRDRQDVEQTVNANVKAEVEATVQVGGLADKLAKLAKKTAE